MNNVNQTGAQNEWRNKARELASKKQFKQLFALIQQGKGERDVDLSWANYWLSSASDSPYLNLSAARAELESLINKGDIVAHVELAKTLIHGSLGETDAYAAEDILRKHADAYPKAKLMLAWIYENGIHVVSGTPVSDVDEAIRLYDEVSNTPNLPFMPVCEAVLSSCRLKLANIDDIGVKDKLDIHTKLQKLFYHEKLNNEQLKKKIAALLVGFFAKEIQSKIGFIFGDPPTGMRQKIDHERRLLRIKGALSDISEDVANYH